MVKQDEGQQIQKESYVKFLYLLCCLDGIILSNLSWFQSKKIVYI